MSIASFTLTSGDPSSKREHKNGAGCFSWRHHYCCTSFTLSRPDTVLNIASCRLSIVSAPFLPYHKILAPAWILMCLGMGSCVMLLHSHSSLEKPTIDEVVSFPAIIFCVQTCWFYVPSVITFREYPFRIQKLLRCSICIFFTLYIISLESYCSRHRRITSR